LQKITEFKELSKGLYRFKVGKQMKETVQIV